VAIRPTKTPAPLWDVAKILAAKPPLTEWDDADIVVAKNPRGKTGVVKMRFEREYVKFSDLN
jgi:replicative DNA helicase